MIADVVPLVNGKRDLTCSGFRKNWFTYLKSERPDLILLADNFDVAISIPGKTPELDFWASKFSDSLKVIASTSKNVVYFSTPPVQKRLVDCVSASGDIGRECLGTASQRNTKRLISARTATRNGVKVIDGSEWTCVFQGCPAIVGNVAVFSADHFSRRFAETLAPLFKAWLSNNGLEN